MFNLQKITKLMFSAVVILTFLVNSIYAFYPELYISYATGMDAKSISNLVKAHDGIFHSNKIYGEELKKICSGLNSTILATTYNNFSSVLLNFNKISFIVSIILFFILLTQKTIDKKYKYGFIFALFLSYFFFIYQYTADWDWFLYGCG